MENNQSILFFSRKATMSLTYKFTNYIFLRKYWNSYLNDPSREQHTLLWTLNTKNQRNIIKCSLSILQKLFRQKILKEIFNNLSGKSWYASLGHYKKNIQNLFETYRTSRAFLELMGFSLDTYALFCSTLVFFFLQYT